MRRSLGSLRPGGMTRILCLLALSACSVLTRHATSSTARSGSPASAEPVGKPAPKDEPREAPLPDVPASWAHPTIAWFVAKTGEVPGIAFGGTGKATVTAAQVKDFALEHAMFAIAPACLRDYKLAKTAAAVAKVEPIRDA